MMGHHPHDHHRPLPPPSSSSSSSPPLTAGVGPTCNSRPKEVMFGSNIYICGCQCDDKVAATSSAAAVGHYTFQPFDISAPTTATSTSTSAFKSPGGGGMAAADLGFPFTWAQWKELERQAMIYKYMTASIPVPPDLLLPIARSLSSTNPMGNANGYLKLGLPNNKEAEVGRCKRTDGKKWRCSRDVAPNQKYCERHLNRGRPRSRKPVEVLVAVQQPEPPTFDNINNKKKSRFDNHNRLPNPENLHSSTTSSHGFLRSDANLHPNGIPLFLDHRHDEDLSVSSYKDLARGLDWTRPELNLNPYTDFGATPYTDFGAPEPEPEPERICLQSQNQMETGRGFIDAWSDKDTNKKPNNSSVASSQSHLWPSSLTLSMAMAAGNVLDEEMGQIGMGLGVGDSEESEIHKARVSSWLSPVSYDVGSYAPGGPLAEMLRPSGMAACSDSNGVSSPSEVLQRTLLSLSDSSGCTSPTVAVPEMIMPFQWLN